MPVFRTPDGKIVEKKTEIADNNTEQVAPPVAAPEQVQPTAGSTVDDDYYDKETVINKGKKGKPRPQSDGKTVLRRPSGRRQTSAVDGVQSDTTENHMEDPVVGWLVVIDGPGMGVFRKLRVGSNKIGRGEDQTVPLDFGDEEISRKNHAVLSYDPRNNNYYIQQGEGDNLVYLNEQPALQPMLLQDKSIIQLGKTTLRFVAFCDDLFNWYD